MEGHFFIHPDAAKELSGAQYVDMLNDSERNELYDLAIGAVVDKSTSLVVDIGTGTGLLSIMSAQKGAKKVVACDTSYPLCRVAEQTARTNNFGSVISIFNKKSTELVVDVELPEKASVCVNEIVDSSLLGEYILPTLRHAIENLLTPSFKMVPYSAKIYGRLIQSEELWKFHSLETSKNFFNLKLSSQCSGGSHEPFEVQFDQVSEHITYLTETETLFSFNFTDITTLQPKDSVKMTLTSIGSGKIHAVLLWWDMVLDEQQKHVLSTTPGASQWRNHWKQCIYFIPQPTQIELGATVDLICNRDDFSLWFDVVFPGSTPSTAPSSCVCDLHGLYRRSRIRMINDYKRNKKYETALLNASKRVSERTGKNEISCLLLGDDPFLGLIAASVGIKVTHKENRSFFREIGTKRIVDNNLVDKFEQLSQLGNTQQKFDIFLSEPFYFDHQRKLPWEELAKFLSEKSEINAYLSPDVEVIPQRADIQGMVVRFDKFQKQFDPVKVPNIDLECFNDVLSCVQPITLHSLWMYQFKPCSEIFNVLSFDLTQPYLDFQEFNNEVSIEKGIIHGVPIWIDFLLGDDIVCSNRPKEVQAPTWKKQAIWMLRKETGEADEDRVLHSKGTFDDLDGVIKINFDISKVEDDVTSD